MSACPVAYGVGLLSFMRNALLFSTLLATFLIGMINTSSAAANGSNVRKVRHVVCFKYKEGTPKAKIAEIGRAFRGLEKKVSGIVSFEMGENDSPEGLNKGFTHCYIVTFENSAAREGYLPHPEHKKFVDLLKPHVEDVFVIDFTL